MSWLSARERTALAVIGILALVACGIVLWQRRTPPLTVAGSLEAGQAARWDAALAHARTVDVNTATVAELEQLPEIGPALARRIVESRATEGPFSAPGELRRVTGIGPAIMQALDGYVTVE